jgi:2-iminobutanoate/2-iminopropanoate deaminase
MEDDSELERAVSIYRTIYGEDGKFRAKMYPGIKELLKTLVARGYTCAVGTMKYEPVAREMMQYFGLAPYFSAMRGSDADGKLNKAMVIDKVCRELGIPNRRTVLVGDTLHDFAGAMGAGVDFIAVRYGFGFDEKSTLSRGIKALLDKPLDLLEILDNGDSMEKNEKMVVVTEKAPSAIGPYSQAVSAGPFVMTSGQIPLHPETGKMATGIEEQTTQALHNLQAVLEAAGSNLSKVVKTTVFLADMDDFAAMNGVYAQFFGEGILPARSAVQVAKLPKAALVEIEAIALR